MDSIRWGDVEIHLGRTSAAPPIDKPVKSKRLVKPGVLGKDGCTAEEQEALYGEVRDAIPPVYEEE